MERLTVAKKSVSWLSHLYDYLSLTKPRVLSLLLLTTLVAMFITGTPQPSASLIFWTLLGGYFAAGGAGALNCALESDIDRKMSRTSKRPVPNGRISPSQAFWFGIVLCILSFLILKTFANLLSALMATLGILYYVVIYTHLLKRRTWWNVVIGGGAGAIAPLVGWTAVTGTLTWQALLLPAIIFFWTPSHSWALALNRKAEYTNACIPMLPVIVGEQRTRNAIFLYSAITVVLTLLPVHIFSLSGVYLLASLVLNILFIYAAWGVWKKKIPILTFYFSSLLYLALLCSAMVIDKIV